MEKFLRSNHFAMGLAIFLAIAMWLFVTGENITRSTPSRKVFHDVVLAVENIEQGLIVVDIPTTVDITLEGLPDAFNGLTIEDLEAYVDLAEKGPGVHQLRVRGRPPRGLKLISFSHDEVEVTLEVLGSSVYQIHAEFLGDPAVGWNRHNYSLAPPQVRAEGPLSVLERISMIVLRVDQSGARESFQDELTPIAIDSQGSELPGIYLYPDKITVNLQFRKIDEDP